MSKANRVFKNKHQAVSQGVRRFGKRSPPEADEHLQKPHNAGSRPQAQFLNTLLKRLDDISSLDEVFDAAAGVPVVGHGRFQPDRHGVFRTEQGV